jgi:NitT/TauT family transport system permease protein
MRNSYFRLALLVASFVAFILIWWSVARAANNPEIVGGPAKTWYEFTQLYVNTSLRTQFISSVEQTLLSILVGFSLSVAVGVPLGVLMGRYLVADLFFEPWVNSWYSVPAIAFVPMTMNWTGVTWISAMITSFLVAVFSITINVYNGVKNCNPSMVDSAISYGATSSQVMLKVILPASLPNIMLALRLGISRAVEGVIIAEMLFTVVGLGGMIDASADKLQLALSYSLIAVLGVIAITLSEATRVLGHRVVAWKESETSVQIYN